MMRYVILMAMMLMCLPVRGEAWQVVGGVAGGGGVTYCSSNPGALFCEDFSSGIPWSNIGMASVTVVTYEGKTALKLTSAGGTSGKSNFLVTPEVFLNGKTVNWRFETFRPCSGGFNLNFRFEAESSNKWEGNVTCGSWVELTGSWSALTSADFIGILDRYNAAGTVQYFTNFRFWQ